MTKVQVGREDLERAVLAHLEAKRYVDVSAPWGHNEVPAILDDLEDSYSKEEIAALIDGLWKQLTDADSH